MHVCGGTKLRAPSFNQWAPTLTAHDPTPPITLETAAGGITDADGSASGVAESSVVGAALWLGLGESTGLGTPLGVAAAVALADAASSGVGTVLSDSNALFAGVFSAAGLATDNFEGADAGGGFPFTYTRMRITHWQRSGENT